MTTDEAMGYRVSELPEVGDVVPGVGVVDLVHRDRGEYRIKCPPGQGFKYVTCTRVQSGEKQ